MTFALVCKGKTYDNFVPEWNYGRGVFTYFFREDGLLELDSGIGELSSGIYRIDGGRLFRSVDGIELQETIRQVDSQWLVTEESETEILTAAEMKDMREMCKEGDFPAKSIRLLKRFVGKEITICKVTYYRRIDDAEESR